MAKPEISTEAIRSSLEDPSISPEWFDEMFRRFQALSELK